MIEAKRPIFVCYVVIAGLTVSAVSKAMELSANKRFQSEAPLAWSKLIELASCVEGECSSIKTDLISGKIILKEPTLPFRVNGRLAYCPFQSDGKSMILCQNSDYEFIVEKLGAEQWGIKQLAWKDGKAQELANEPYFDPKDGTIRHEPWQMALAYACRGLRINITWLPHLASSSSFQVVEATNVTAGADGGDLVRVQFVNRAVRGPGITIESGEIILDAKRYWQILKAHVSAHYGHEGPDQYDIVYDVTNEFEVADNRMPYVRLHRLRTQSLPLLDEERVCETKIALRDRSDVKPFRLPAFGLREPSKDPPKGARKLSLFHANLLCVIVLACVILYQKAP